MTYKCCFENENMTIFHDFMEVIVYFNQLEKIPELNTNVTGPSPANGGIH